MAGQLTGMAALGFCAVVLIVEMPLVGHVQLPAALALTLPPPLSRILGFHGGRSSTKTARFKRSKGSGRRTERRRKKSSYSKCFEEDPEEETSISKPVRLCHLQNGGGIAEQAKRRKGKKLRRIIIDIDPTCDPTYGAQQLTFFNGFYKTHCYLPLVVTISFGWERRKYPVAAVLRAGTAGPMVGTMPVVRRLVQLLRNAFGSVRLYLRADSSFAVPKFFDFLEAENMRYAIAMGSNSVLEGLSQALMEQARRQAADRQETATLYGESLYQSGGWKRKRAAAYKAQVLVHPDKDDHRDNDRYLIHNLDYRYGPQGAFALYYGHSDIENRIKELKNDLSMDRTSCSQFAANQFRLIMTLAAYALMQSVAEHTSDRDLLKAQMATLRDRLLKVAVRVRSSARRISLEFTSHHPWAESWINAALGVGAVPT